MDHRIEARIAALENEISSLRRALATEPDAGPVTSDRRGMVKLLAASAVGAVTGAALLGAQPAAALDGEPLTVGNAFTGESETRITTSAGTALALVGNGLSDGIGLEADGERANALFNGTGESPVGLGATLGSLYVDGVGNWWAAVTTETPAVWRKLAGPSTAGQLHVLPAPVRVYDSRPGELPATEPKVQMQVNVPRTIDTRNNSSGVPDAAAAVLITLTVVGPAAAGFATAWPSGDIPSTSTINFAPGQTIATTTTVGCGPLGSIQILSNSVLDFLVDVIGFYQ